MNTTPTPEPTTLKQLAEMHHARKLAKHSEVPAQYVPKTKFSDKSANDLTKSIIAYMDAIGGHANRLQSQGQYVPDKVETVNGRRVVAVKGGFRKGTTKAGTADVMVAYRGIVVMVEVKYGKDRQSEKQKGYQLEVEGAGVPYLIAKTFEQFTADFSIIIKSRI